MKYVNVCILYSTKCIKIAMKIITKTKVPRVMFLAGIAIFATALLLITNGQSSSVSAQTSNGTDTFQAKGVMGNLALSPDTLSSLNASKDTNLNFILGGNWSFDVSKGQLKDFKMELNRHSLVGHEVETHVIDGLDNATGLQTSGNNQILLMGNNTQFKGLADIKTVETGNVWEDVPVVVYLINGHILNTSFDVAKTQGHFVNLPLFGVVTSLTNSTTAQ